MLGFFRHRRPELKRSGSPVTGIQIPEGYEVDYLLGRVISRCNVNPADLNNGVYSWEQIYELSDMLDLQDWIEWESHVKASER